MLGNDTLPRSFAGLAGYARKRGLFVSSAEVLDGVAACVETAPRSLGELQEVLRSCLAKSLEDTVLFDQVFREYFYDEKMQALSAVLGWAIHGRNRRKAGDKAAKEPFVSRNEPDSSAGDWSRVLLSSPGVPDSFKLFVNRDKHSAAARLVKEPLTEADKRSLVAAFSRIADRVGRDDLARVREMVQDYGRLAGEVERLRSARTRGTVHTGHSEKHDWSSAAYFVTDGAPPEILNAQLEALSKDHLDRLIAVAERAAAALKPFFSREAGIGRKRLTLDYRRTVRDSLATLGEPFRLHYGARHRRLRRVVTVCDVSGSVRKATGILLAFLYGLHQAFEGRARHFLFVSEVDEVTPYFSLPSYQECYARISGAAGVDFRGYSNYGKALSILWDQYRSAFDYETVVFFLGDARTNRYDPRADLVRAIRATVRDAFFLNPEEPGKWGTADSAVGSYDREIAMIDISRFGDLLDFLTRLPRLVVAH